jgi:hypothetical protein
VTSARRAGEEARKALVSVSCCAISVLLLIYFFVRSFSLVHLFVNG